jgi:hypothetical protein
LADESLQREVKKPARERNEYGLGSSQKKGESAEMETDMTDYCAKLLKEKADLYGEDSDCSEDLELKRTLEQKRLSQQTLE